jgi:predicted TPR repeat methyltransferase
MTEHLRRYAHSASYIETLHNQCGFSLEASRPVVIRNESSKSSMGRIYILSLRPLDSAAI